MVKKPKPDSKSKANKDDLSETVQDAVEDAVVIEEIAPDEPDTEQNIDLKEPPELPDDQEDEQPGAATQDGANDEGEHIGAEDDPAEPDLVPEPAAVPVIQKRRGFGVFSGLLLGGAAAALIGFGAARYVVPEGWPFPGTTPQEDPIAQTVDAQSRLIEQLSEKIGANETRIADLVANTSTDEMMGELRADTVAGQAQLNEDISAIVTRIDAIDARLTALEKIPQGSGAEAAQTAANAYERDLTALRSMFEAELAKISNAQENAQKLEVNAAEAAKAATARAALSRVMAALETGQPFDQALFDLETATGEKAPTALAAHAKDGAPTLPALQASFPDVARSALDASIRAAVEDGSMDRMSAFLRTQLGTRSLEPQEGNDPDAILSRAEFELKNGRIAEALAELETMPPVAQPILSDWMARAQARSDAISAGQSLAETTK